MWRLRQQWRHWQIRCELPECAGPSKKASKLPKARQDWTSTRFGVGPAGIGISRWRCGRKHSCQWCERNGVLEWHQKRGGRIWWGGAVWHLSKPTAGSGRSKLCRNSAAVLAAGSGGGAHSEGSSGLVRVAAMAPSMGSILPLSEARQQRASTAGAAGN